MLKVTKKEIKEYIKGIKNVISAQNWTISVAGAYVKDRELYLYCNYNGEGIDANIWNALYTVDVVFTDVVESHLNRELTIEDVTNEVYNKIYNKIYSMIEELNNNNIGNNILDILKNKGISIRKMSKDLNMDYSVAHALANRDDLSNITLGRLVEVADYLDVDIKELYT